MEPIKTKPCMCLIKLESNSTKREQIPLNTHKNIFGSKEKICTDPLRQPSIVLLSSPPSLFSTTNSGGKVANPNEYSKEEKEIKKG